MGDRTERRADKLVENELCGRCWLDAEDIRYFERKLDCLNSNLDGLLSNVLRDGDRDIRDIEMEIDAHYVALKKMRKIEESDRGTIRHGH